LVDSMNDIIWSLSAKDVLLEDLLIYMKVNFSELIDSVKKQFEFISPEVIPNIELSYDKKRNIYLVCKEAIHNAIKHSNATHISLQWHYDGKSFFISIIDNGKGFDVNLKGKKGNGLQNLSKRMHAIGGFVALQSGKSGTKVEFKVPLQML
jgi:two-component system, NarL family, sensor kinase